MRLDQMYSCCGIGVIHGLPETAGTSSKTAFDGHMASARRGYNLVIVSINEDQKAHWNAHFKKSGLNLVNEFDNRNSGNTVYLYTKEF